MASLEVAPVLSTPAEDALFQRDIHPVHHHELTEIELDLQYEIKQTIEEIRSHSWHRIGLQFPDEMLVDAPRVLSRLRDGLRNHQTSGNDAIGHPDKQKSAEEHSTHQDSESRAIRMTGQEDKDAVAVKLTILGDTSYGSCCVDEIAAEHIAADAVVHYGRTCLSPTQRLPVVYIYTARPLDTARATSDFVTHYKDKSAQICLLADVPWQSHLQSLAEDLTKLGYSAISVPDLIHNPSSIIPNRALPQYLQDPASLLQTDIFHVGDPPTALLLTLATRVRSLHVYSPDTTDSAVVHETAVSALSRRRYASLLKLSSAAVIGILINTLSVKNYLTALEHVQSLIDHAGKKSYTFVVGKLNPAKLANFAEIGGWVVIGCWESSLIESKEFLAPVINPFELELALKRDDQRVWGQEWVADFQTLLSRREQTMGMAVGDPQTQEEKTTSSDASSDDEPPEFDLRTGRYVSHSRPMASRSQKGRIRAQNKADGVSDDGPSTALTKRVKGELAVVNGVASPGAQYLRTKREWQGLGSDFEVAYDRDEHGNIQGAAMEQGRAGVAKGYAHLDGDDQK